MLIAGEAGRIARIGKGRLTMAAETRWTFANSGIEARIACYQHLKRNHDGRLT
jgi:hypothetical protein